MIVWKDVPVGEDYTVASSKCVGYLGELALFEVWEYSGQCKRSHGRWRIICPADERLLEVIYDDEYWCSDSMPREFPTKEAAIAAIEKLIQEDAGGGEPKIEHWA